MNIERIVIIGAGAVGGSIGGLIASVGVPVVLVARGAHGHSIQQSGLRLKLFDGEQVVSAACFENLGDVDWRAGDVAILATKLNDVEPALDQLLESAGENIPVVCATNGVAAESWAGSRFETVIGMMVWLPATHLLPGEVILHSSDLRGVLDVGAIKEEINSINTSKDIAEMLTASGFDSHVQDNIMAWKRAKWITNLGGAAQALVEDDWMAVLEAAQQEGESVLEKSGLSRIPTRDLLARCDSVKMTDMAGFERSGGSTWQSRQRGKPLESLYIEGAMADLGESLGVPVPVNRALAEASRHNRVIASAEILETNLPGDN